MWNGHAVISYSTSHDQGRSWAYGGVALREPFHLSYPYMFHHEGVHYMIPETNKDMSVRLYMATDYPADWALAKVLLAGRHYVDSVVFHHLDLWWLFTC